jgi:hypothetical protein
MKLLSRLRNRATVRRRHASMRIRSTCCSPERDQPAPTLPAYPRGRGVNGGGCFPGAVCRQVFGLTGASGFRRVSYCPPLPEPRRASARRGGRSRLPLRGQSRIHTGFPLARARTQAPARHQSIVVSWVLSTICWACGKQKTGPWVEPLVGRRPIVRTVPRRNERDSCRRRIPESTLTSSTRSRSRDPS